MVQIPYADIGLGVAVIIGIWAFLVAETIKERVIIACVPIVLFLIPRIIRSPTGALIALICWMLYGIGCLIYLKFQGFPVR